MPKAPQFNIKGLVLKPRALIVVVHSSLPRKKKSVQSKQVFKKDILSPNKAPTKYPVIKPTTNCSPFLTIAIFLRS